MFVGRYYHSLENKGRVAIPPIFRRNLGKSPIITRGLDGCLFVVPADVWLKLTADLRGSPLTKQDTREFIRLIAHDAQEMTFDGQGRTLIPQPLRDYAKITKEVVVAGSLDWIEIWNRDLYHEHMSHTEKQAAAVAERLANLGGTHE